MGCYNVSIERKRLNKYIPSKKVEINNYFQDINSKYILKHILNFLPKKKQLELVKYSKVYQRKLDICVNDYKEFCE